MTLKSATRRCGNVRDARTGGSIWLNSRRWRLICPEVTYRAELCKCWLTKVSSVGVEDGKNHLLRPSRLSGEIVEGIICDGSSARGVDRPMETLQSCIYGGRGTVGSPRVRWTRGRNAVAVGSARGHDCPPSGCTIPSSPFHSGWNAHMGARKCEHDCRSRGFQAGTSTVHSRRSSNGY